MLANAQPHFASAPQPPRGRPPSRDRILASARAMLAQGSYLAFTMEALARASGLSRQTLYNQFADRDALYRQSRRALLDAFVSALPRRFDPALTLEPFIGRCLAVLARPEHVELSRSAELDGAACPWVALLYRSEVERPLARVAERHIAAVCAVADAAGPAAGLVDMLRASVRGGAPAFSAKELARLFLGRLPAEASAARELYAA